MQLIPLQAVKNQAFTVLLGGQNVSLAIRQTSWGVFMDVYKDGSLVIAGVICQNANRIVRSSYLGFIGDLTFFDTEGSSDPEYSGLGSRYQLAYLEASDLA